MDDSTKELVRRALAEDLGEGDVTTAVTVPEEACARATIVQKDPGVIFGLELAEQAFRELDPDARFTRLVDEGDYREGGRVLEIEGRARAILSAERTALNLLQRMSGIATMTRRFVAAVEGSEVRVLDTRKTTPGLRDLEKAAVRAGGGTNHRRGLDDAILIKENHARLAGGVGEAVRRAKANTPAGMPLEVECSTLEEVEEALEAGAERLLLDNMSPDGLRAAVARVDGRAVLEASGGIGLDALRDYAATGIQFVSIGALTHSAPALDLSLELEPIE